MVGLVEMILAGNVRQLVGKFTGFTYKITLGRLARGKNNYLDLGTLKAYSYNWWCYFRPIGSLGVFNSERYSSTTSKHQRDMGRLLSKLGVGVDIHVYTLANMEYWDLDDLEQQLQLELQQAIAELQDCKRKVSGRRERAEGRISEVESYIDTVQRELGKLVQISIGGHLEQMTEREYAEWRLTASTGDFHTHRIVS